MNKLLLSTAALSLLVAAASAQVNYSENFNTSSAGWTGNTLEYITNGTACSGNGIAVNIWTATHRSLVSPNIGTSLNGSTTVTFDYKIHNWSANTVATTGSWGSVNLEYGATATGPWTLVQTWANEVQTSGVCLNRVSNVFNPPAGNLFIRFRGVRTSGDWYLNIDNVVVTEASGACSGTPAPGNTTGPAVAVCNGSTIALGLQNATTGTGVTYQWYANGNPVGPNAATYNALILGNTTYYCDVTCTSSGFTGSSNPLAVTVDPTATNPQDFEAGLSGCWSNLGGGVTPDLRPVSGFGVGAQAVRFAFDGWGNVVGQQGLLTSPVLSTNPGDRVFLDVAAAIWPGFGPDTIIVEESTDGGATWNTLASDTNAVGGLWNTGGSVATPFVPTAAQWKNHSFPLSIGANRVRVRGVSGWGNDCFVDNVVVGPAGYARHYQYGVACVPGYEITASPAPTPSTTVTYTANNIPQWVSAGIYASALALGFAADVPGTDLLTASFGTFDSPCLAHLTLAGLVDVVFLPGNAATDTWNFLVPPLCPLGAQLFVQGVAQTDYVFPTNPSGLVTSRALETYVGAF